mmetsp:Transcript_6155/g.8254  ORF Transcript_6155/g.8254 Transcript_6155/m.8254 type:complete len:146 (-) Transcript_6155:1314-1751(-)
MTFLLESCIEIGFCSTIAIKFMSNERFANPSEFLSSTLAYWFAFALVIAPIYLIISGYRLHKAIEQKDEEQIERYQGLFAGKRLTSAWAIQHSLVFFARRYLIVGMVMQLPHYTFAQLLLMLHGSLLVTLYTQVARPFEEPIMNK